MRPEETDARGTLSGRILTVALGIAIAASPLNFDPDFGADRGSDRIARGVLVQPDGGDG